MTYQVLKKVYYQDEEKYKSLYKSRIESECRKCFDIEINGNNAFYVYSPDVVLLLEKIYDLNNKIISLYNSLPDIALKHFTKKCLIDEICLSNDIEGVYSSRQELNIILNKKSNAGGSRFYGLVHKYEMLANESISIDSSSDIRSIYDELVLPEVVEDDPKNAPDGLIFRKEITNIYSETQKVIHKGLYPEAKIIETMEKAINVLSDDEIPYLIRISIFHYLFGFIHPFYDGNGRTSRFISSYLLSKRFVPIIGYRLSYTIKENLKKYYEAFKVCNDKRNLGDITPFIIMFLEIVSISFERLYEALFERMEMLKFYKEKVANLSEFSNDDKKLIYVLVQCTIFSSDGITKDELCRVLGISKSTLDKRLKIIEELIIKNPIGRVIHYTIDIDNII